MGRAPTKTKQNLINTAIDLIWMNSYGSVSVDDICMAAQVNKGSFYHYFPSKLELTVAALDDFYNQSKPLFDEVFNPQTPPQQRFIDLCDLIYEHQKETKEKYGRVCGCPFLSLGSELASKQDIIQSKILEISSIQVQYYKKTIIDMIANNHLSKDIVIDKKASQIYAFIMGHIMMGRIQDDLEPLKNNLKTGIFNILEVSTSAQAQIKETI